MQSSKLLKNLQIYGNLLPGTNFALVTIHPLADEHDLLHQLARSPEICQVCDLYWAYDPWLFFVSIAYMPALQPYATLQRKERTQHDYAFTVRTHVCPLYTAHVHQTIAVLAAWVNDHVEMLTSMQPREYRIVSTADLAATT